MLVNNKIFTTRPEVDIRIIAAFFTNLLWVSNCIAILEQATKMIEAYLLSRDDLPADISAEPLFYVGLSLCLESEVIFEQAMTHAVGRDLLHRGWNQPRIGSRELSDNLSNVASAMRK